VALILGAILLFVWLVVVLALCCLCLAARGERSR
jgi:hypothetical protein